MNGHELDYEGLRDVLMSLDPSAPQELMDDLYYVHEMSDDNGMDELLAACVELGHPANENAGSSLLVSPLMREAHAFAACSDATRVVVAVRTAQTSDTGIARATV